MPEISEKKIINAALRGVSKAQSLYKELSGGYWLWEAPEYLTTVCVAEEIGALPGKKYLTLENSAYSAIKDAGARGRGKLPNDMRANGRTDILLWSSNEQPRAPIEVKVQVTNSKKILSDSKRIEKMVHRAAGGSSIDFGMIVYYISLRDSKSGKLAKDKINERIEKICESVTNEIGSRCSVQNYSSAINSEEDSAWAAVALVIKHVGN